MKLGSLALSALLTCCLFECSAQADTSALPSAFRNITAAGSTPAIGSSYLYAARPDFSRPVLSPSGKYVAFVARMQNSVTTLVVVDISADKSIPVMRLDVPYMKGVDQFAWASDDKLAVWLDMDTSNSSDDDPSSGLYMAMVDIANKKVTERVQGTKMTADVAAPYPLTSELVRAPFREADHVLINECQRQGGVNYVQRGEAANFTFATTQSLPSSTIVCQLLDWDLNKNRASAIVRPFYTYPTRFFVNYNGDNLFAEGRRVGGKQRFGSITQNPETTKKNKKWDNEYADDTTVLQPIWDNNEMDNPELWKKVHQILPNQVYPAGNVVKTSGSGIAVGIQFTSPEYRFVALDPNLASANDMFARVFAKLDAYAGANVRWISTSEDKGTVLFELSSLKQPGSYFVWHKDSNTILRITDGRAMTNTELAGSYLEPGWLPDYLPVVVTPTKNNQIKGFVLIPEVVSDDSTTSVLREVDMTAEWFAANGLLTVRVPVGLPAALPEEQRGDAWRKLVAARLNSVVKNLRLEYPKARQDDVPVCLYGRDINAYAALAGAANGAPASCVIAVNPKLDPELFEEPFLVINTTAKTWYLTTDNATLYMWRTLYGQDLAAGTPGNWNFPGATNLMLSYEMFDDSRTMSNYLGDIKKAVTQNGGKYTQYSPNLMAAKADQWLANQYDEMIKFMLPPENKKIGKVTVQEVNGDEIKIN